MSETKSTTSTLKDVYFFYTSVSVPEKQLNPDGKPAESEHPLEGHSFEIKILVPEKDYKQMKKEYKGAKNFDKDRHGLEVIQTTALGYGTKGHLQFRPVKNDFGLYLYPNALCITDLVEYVEGAGSVDEEAFGIEALDDADIDEVVSATEGDLDEDLEF